MLQKPVNKRGGIMGLATLARTSAGRPGAPSIPPPPRQTMRPCPGVRIEDMGHKMGCNGVDNGKLWFDRESPALPCLAWTLFEQPERQ